MRLVRAITVAVAAALIFSNVAAQTSGAAPGRLLFVKDGDLWVLTEGGPHVMATGGTFTQPSWAPDGSNLAYVYRGTNFSDIFVADGSGDSQTRLTTSQSTVLDNNDWNMRPTWSPDGKLIAYVSDRATAFPTLWLMNASDGSARRPLPSPGIGQEAVDSMSWSPDGGQLAVTLFNEPGPTQIALLPMASTGRQLGHVLTTVSGGALDPAWSPDGVWLAFAGRDSTGIDIYAIHPDGSGLSRLTNDGLLARSPVWSPDGQRVAYLSNKTGYYEVFSVDVTSSGAGAIAPSSTRQLTQDLHVDAASGLSWSR